MKFCRLERDPIDAELVGSRVHQPFDDEVRDLGAEAAIGALLALVGQHGGQIDLDAVDAVGTHALRERVAVLADAELQIGAIVVDDPGLQAEQRAIALERELGVVDAVRRVVVAARGVVDPVFHELDRPPHRARQHRSQHRNLVDEHLAAEAAARQRRHDIELVGRHAERACDHPAAVVVHRRVALDGEAAHAVIEARHGAHRLQRLAARARPAEAALDDQIGGREILLHRPEGELALERDIGVATRGVQDGIACRGQRLFGIDDRGQRFVFDLDQIAGVLGDVAILRRHRRHRLADVAHSVMGDHRLEHRRARPGGERVADFRGIGAGHHAKDAGERLSLAHVDGDDPGMGMGAPQHRRVRHLGQIHVVGIDPLADQEARVLHPLHALADPLQIGTGLLPLPALGDVAALAHGPSFRINRAACWIDSTMV